MFGSGCCCCKNRGKVHGYVGPPTQQPVTVTAVITQASAPTYPVPVHYPNYSTAEVNATIPISSSSRAAPPPYTETVSAPPPLMPQTVNDYPQQTAYNPKY